MLECEIGPIRRRIMAPNSADKSHYKPSLLITRRTMGFVLPGGTIPIVRRVCVKSGGQFPLYAEFASNPADKSHCTPSSNHCPRVQSGLEPILSRLAFNLALLADLIRMNTTYRVSQLVVDLGWVDFDLRVPPSGPTAQPHLPNSHQPGQS